MARTSACLAVLAALLAIPTALAVSAAERTARASIDGHAILIDSKPFFPVMLIDQCDAGAAARAQQLGVNLILNESCAGISASRQLTQAAPGAFAVLPIREQSVEGKRLVGWAFPDEPDNNGWTPASLRKQFAFRPGSPDGLLSFITTSGRFFGGVYRNPSVPESVFGQFAKLSDVAGFDLYPLNHCTQDLSVVAAAQQKFIALAGGRPTFQWIETGQISPSYCGGFAMTPDELAAETWLAIVGGARGIGFFTHTWTPEHNAFDVAPAIQQAIRQTSQTIAALAPGLTGQTVPSGTNSGAIRVLARSAGDRTYVIAVNTYRTPIKAQLNVPSLADGALPSFAGGSSLKVSHGRVVDTFPPLGVHIYVQSSAH